MAPQVKINKINLILRQYHTAVVDAKMEIRILQLTATQIQ